MPVADDPADAVRSREVRHEVRALRRAGEHPAALDQLARAPDDAWSAAERAEIEEVLRTVAPVCADPSDPTQVLGALARCVAEGRRLPDLETSLGLRVALAEAPDRAEALFAGIGSQRTHPPIASLEAEVLLDALDLDQATRLVLAHGGGEVPERLAALAAAAGLTVPDLADGDPAAVVADVLRRVANPLQAPSSRAVPLVAVVVGSLRVVQGARLAALLSCAGLDPWLLHDERLPADPGLVELLARGGVPVRRWSDGAADAAVQRANLALGCGGSAGSLAGLLRDLAPDVVHVLGGAAVTISGALGALAAGTPRIVLNPRGHSPAHGGEAVSAFGRREALWRTALRAALDHDPDRFALVANGPTSLRSHEVWLGTGPRPQHAVVQNLLDVEVLQMVGRTDVAAPWPSDARVVAGVFRLEPVKRPALWAAVGRALTARHDDLHLVHLGTGRLATALDDVPRLHRLGFRTPVAPWLARCDLLLHTSGSEGVPNACLEAQALGVPVVAADVGGVAEALDGGRTGLLLDADAPVDDWVTAVEAALDPTWRADVAERAPRWLAERVGPEAQLAAVLPYYGLDPGRHLLDRSRWRAAVGS